MSWKVMTTCRNFLLKVLSGLRKNNLASCMVIDVRENASLCLITKSLREIVYGDRVEMRIDSEKEPRAALR